jgi:hypothetical protein
MESRSVRRRILSALVNLVLITALTWAVFGVILHHSAPVTAGNLCDRRLRAGGSYIWSTNRWIRRIIVVLGLRSFSTFSSRMLRYSRCSDGGRVCSSIVMYV